MFTRHDEKVVRLAAPVAQAFAYLDDFRKLSAHMERSSVMMLGSRMAIQTDAAGGRAVGSTVRMSGRILGMTLALDEVVIERRAPFRKVWQTLDARLLVIGQYQLGFELAEDGPGSRARIFIDYALPPRAPARWLGQLFAGWYARWCVSRMAADAERVLGGAAARITRWKRSS